MNENTPKPGTAQDVEEVRKHFRAVRQEMRAGIQALLPPEARQHGRKARKEMLLAWRSVIDAALQRLEDSDRED